MEVFESEQDYLGYHIRAGGGRVLTRFGFMASVRIATSQGERGEVAFTEYLDDMTSGWPSDQNEAAKLLVERAVHRAQGAILLDRLQELDGQQFVVPDDEHFAERSDDYIRRLLLLALDRVVRLQPDGTGRESFDDIGVCLMAEIQASRVQYVINRLKGDGLIEYFSMGDVPGNRRFRATPEGLRLADKLRDETRAPSVLLEETVAEVERALGRYSPELVTRLRSLSLKIAEARELSHVDVGEIAQSCDLILQEFLDLSVLWDGVTATKPARDKTKERLSMLLKAKVASETEEDLVKGLGDYLFGWFGPLDKFVNKHRHPVNPELSTRLHAKRLVLYTYLLLADLIELLGL